MQGSKKLYINNWRRLVSNKIRAQLPSSAIIIDSPDHPFLLDGPDVLVAVEGKITAIFMENQAETLSNERRLSLRVKLSRAALPLHSNFLYFGKRELTDGLSSVFNEIYEDLSLYGVGGRYVGSSKNISIPESLLKIVSERRSVVRAVELDARAEIFRRFGAVFWGSQVNIAVKSRSQHQELGVSDASDISGLIKADRIHPNSVRAFIFGEKSPSHHWIVIENGFASPGADALGFVISKHLPSVSGDPEKYLRSLAFAGWLAADEMGDSYRFKRVKRLVAGRSDVKS